MRIFKRVVSLFLVLVMLLASLSACSKEPAPITLNGRALTDYTFLIKKGVHVDWEGILSELSSHIKSVFSVTVTVANYDDFTDKDRPKRAIVFDGGAELFDQHKYTVKEDGKGFVVVAGSNTVALMLLNSLRQNELKSAEGGQVALTLAAKEASVLDRISDKTESDLRAMTFNTYGMSVARAPYVTAAVLSAMPDFVGFQEHNTAGEFNDVLKSAGYAVACSVIDSESILGAASQSNQYTHIGQKSRTWIYYRADRWEKVETKCFLYYWCNRCVHSETKSVSIAVFRAKDDPNKTVLFINTHCAVWLKDYAKHNSVGCFESGNVSSPAPLWRFGNSMELLMVLEEYRTKYVGALTVLTGDLNANETAESIKLLEANDVLSSAYLMAPEGQRGLGGTSHSIGAAPSVAGKAIDHIFVSEDVATVQSHRIINDYYTLKASDHCPVVADISWK